MNEAFKLFAVVVLFLVYVAGASVAQLADTPTQPMNAVLFQNVKVFDGRSENLSAMTSVLVVGNKIAEIGARIETPANATVIDGAGRTLMPGLIDNHWHAPFATTPQAKVLQSDFGYLTLVAARNNRDALMRGFTSVRDVGGNVFGIKKATDEGLVVGPRIYPSGAYLSQTSGHGDFLGPNDVPMQPARQLTYFESIGMTIIADGVPDVTKRARENLRQGATQLKVMAGGGVSSLYDPLDVTQYTLAEMKAIVEVAETWNTYVTVHAFTPHSIRQSIEAGVKCIEHGHLLDEKTIQLMAEKDVWLSMQPVLDDEDAIPFAEGSVSRIKFVQVTAGTDMVYRLAKKHNVKLAWGTDTLFDAELAKKQGKQLAKLHRWFEPHEILRMATHDNAQLLKLCGPRDPYPGQGNRTSSGLKCEENALHLVQIPSGGKAFAADVIFDRSVRLQN